MIPVAPLLLCLLERTLVSQQVVDATPAQVWRAWTVPEEIVQWMGVAKAEMDLRVGGAMRTTYDPNETLGGDQTIVNEILAYEPERMLAIRAVDGPEGFDIERFAGTWSVVRLQPLDAGRTEVTVTGLGWGEGPEWDQLYAKFEQGNAWTLQRLAEHFHAGASAPLATEAERSRYAACIAAAEASLRLHEPAAVRRWLDEAPASLRGFEWRLLDARSDQSLVHVTAHGQEGAFGLRVSHDGRRVLTTSDDRTAQLWDTATGAHQLTLAGHEGGVFAGAFTPDGARIVTVSDDRTARVWDAASGAQLSVLLTHSVPVAGVDVSPDGSRIALCTYEEIPEAPYISGLVLVYDAATGAELARGHGGEKPLVLLRFSPDGRFLAAPSWNGHAFIWDAATGALLHELSLQKEGAYSAVDCVAWSPDGTLLAAGAKNGWVRVFDAATGEARLTLEGHAGNLGGVAFRPDGRVLASGGQDGTVRYWSVPDGAPLAVLHGPTRSVRGMDFAPDGSALWTAASDGSLRSWPGDPAAANDRVLEHAGCYDAAWSADGRRVASVSSDGSVRVWDPATARVEAQLENPDLSATAVCFLPDGRVAAGFEEGHVIVYDVAAGAEPVRLEHGESGVMGLACSPDGSLLATHRDDSLRVWDAHGEVLFDTGPSGDRRASFSSIAFAPDGRRVAGPWGADVAVFDVEGGARAQTLSGPGAAMWHTLFAPDGARLFGATGEADVACWDVASGATIWARDRILDAYAWRIGLSPDGSRMSVASGDLRLLDAGSGDELLRLVPCRDSLYTASFSPDGQRLLCAGSAGDVVLIDSRPLRAR